MEQSDQLAAPNLIEHISTRRELPNGSENRCSSDTNRSNSSNVLASDRTDLRFATGHEQDISCGIVIVLHDTVTESGM